MLFSQISFDLGSIFSSGKVTLAVLLIVVALGTALWPWLKSFGNNALASNTKPKRRDVDRSSDTPPPAGFAAHLCIIEATAPNADAKVWWEYAKAEMTEAEVAIAEAKLARRADPDKIV
jgi:ABC-type transport system involved in multi-copper enzyme maturation permease subunit